MLGFTLSILRENTLKETKKIVKYQIKIAIDAETGMEEFYIEKTRQFKNLPKLIHFYQSKNCWVHVTNVGLVSTVSCICKGNAVDVLNSGPHE